MEDKDFNPLIEAVTTIRQLATAIVGNWSTMKSTGTLLTADMEKASLLVSGHGENETKKLWQSLLEEFDAELHILKEIMSDAIDKIKRKEADGISENWKKHPVHVQRIEKIYDELEQLGRNTLPENEIENWKTLWLNINASHKTIKSEADSIGIQLQLIDTNGPAEVDELTDTILRHIPMSYSKEEAHKYNNEYMVAYEEIKKEASQKKNLWDRFLDILAGGVQQTPAQRVMMQRWVDGEKGDSH